MNCLVPFLNGEIKNNVHRGLKLGVTQHWLKFVRVIFLSCPIHLGSPVAYTTVEI